MEEQMRTKPLSSIGLSIIGALLVVLVVVTVASGFEANTISPTRLRVAHLVPGADTLPGTAVDVKIDGTQVLTAFHYLSSTTYFETGRRAPGAGLPLGVRRTSDLHDS